MHAGMRHDVGIDHERFLGLEITYGVGIGCSWVLF